MGLQALASSSSPLRLDIVAHHEVYNRSCERPAMTLIPDVSYFNPFIQQPTEISPAAQSCQKAQ